MITGGDLRQSRLDVGYKTFTISPWIPSRLRWPSIKVNFGDVSLIQGGLGLL